MNIDDLLTEGRAIWGQEKLTLAGIIVRLGKVFGDICRYERDAIKDKAVHTPDELKKELGNIIFSTIRWCDDLGFDPKDCIEAAVSCQRKFQK
jgi:hypothetical protein